MLQDLKNRQAFRLHRLGAQCLEMESEWHRQTYNAKGHSHPNTLIPDFISIDGKKKFYREKEERRVKIIEQYVPR